MTGSAHTERVIARPLIVFQFRRTHNLTPSLHGKKLKADKLAVPGPGANWF